MSEKKPGLLKASGKFGENEHAKWVEILEEQRRQLFSVESNDLRLRESPLEESEEELSCVFERTCYAAKSNMGKCPCELRYIKQ